MQLLTSVDRAALSGAPLLAQSGEFAVFDMGSDTYALVQRHQGVEWQGFTVSGDSLFRMSELLVGATRVLYREIAARLSPKNRDSHQVE